MFGKGEDDLKMKLLEMLMGEMDDLSAEKLKKKPEIESVEIEVEPLGEEESEDEMDMGMMGMEESPEEKLKKRIEMMRKKA